MKQFFILKYYSKFLKPNGGKQQPGCPSLATLITGLLSNVSGSISGVSCSHARAILFFEESILSPCKIRK